jgi:hypothetical protein
VLNPSYVLSVSKSGKGRAQQQVVRNCLVEGGKIEVCNPPTTESVVFVDFSSESLVRTPPAPKKENATWRLHDVAEHALKKKGLPRRCRSCGHNVSYRLQDYLVF